MGYVGMWVDLEDGPKERVYKSRGRKEQGWGPESAVKRRRRLPPGTLAGGIDAGTQTGDLCSSIPSISLLSFFPFSFTTIKQCKAYCIACHNSLYT